MLRVAKPEGKYRIALEEAPIPDPRPDEVRLRAVRTLISRGSEIGRRYVHEEAIDPSIMGYSLAGVVDAVGADIDHFAVGDRAVARAPHAQYVVRPARTQFADDQPFVYPLASDVSFDRAPYWFLTAASVTWIETAGIARDDVVAIVGQGLVGSLMLQVARANGNGHLVAIDALDLRCELAQALGADIVVNASNQDPVQAVRRLTAGLGADIVVYAVGGPAGPAAFAQSLEMLRVNGTLILVGRYERAPLPLVSSDLGGKRIVDGNFGHKSQNDAHSARRAMDLLSSGQIDTERMTTHHFPYTRAADAFDLLYNRAGETMGVVLDWDGADG